MKKVICYYHDIIDNFGSAFLHDHAISSAVLEYKATLSLISSGLWIRVVLFSFVKLNKRDKLVSGFPTARYLITWGKSFSDSIHSFMPIHFNTFRN